MAVIAASRKEDEDLQKLLSHFVHLAQGARSDRGSQGSLNVAVLRSLLNILTKDYTPDQYDIFALIVRIFSCRSVRFSDGVTYLVRQLQECLFIIFLPQVTSSSLTADSVKCSWVLNGWRNILCLRRWLGVDCSQTPFVAITAARRVFSSRLVALVAEAGLAILDVALEELYLDVSDRFQHLDFIVVAYMTLKRIPGTSEAVDVLISRASQRFPVSDFDHMLEAIVDGIQDQSMSSRDLLTLIQLSGLLSQSPPDGASLKYPDSVRL